MNADGWQARLLSWVLAVLATLAIVGAVATMSTTGSSGSAAPRDAATDATTARVDPRTGAPEAPTPAPFTLGAPRPDRVPTEATRQTDALRDIAGWLAALTYAVLALVAVAAVGVLALFRMGRQRAER